jgi:antirestriction protein ArdC
VEAKYRQLKIQEGAEGDAATRLVAMMREHSVFNLDQCENLTDSVKTGKPRRAFAIPTVATTLPTIS